MLTHSAYICSMGNITVRAVALPHCEDILVKEAESLSIQPSSISASGIEFSANLQKIYRFLIENRSASRLIFPLGKFSLDTQKDLYDAVAGIPWEDHLDSAGSFIIDSSVKSHLFKHTNFPVLKAKDAIVDRLRTKTGSRPNIDNENPGVRLFLRVFRNDAEISIDIGGGSRHQRGYRKKNVAAPLRENLAAAILYRAGWPETAAGGGAFHDPFCGSGTLCVEAALMAAGIAPGADREKTGIRQWKLHDRTLWETLVEEYRQSNKKSLESYKKNSLSITGTDIDPDCVAAARINAATAGLEGCISFSSSSVHTVHPVSRDISGLIATNPPYGERLENDLQARVIYTDMGVSLRQNFSGWKLSFLAPDKELGLMTGIQAGKIHKLSNGSIPVQLIHGVIPEFVLSAGSEMFINRLKKNRRQLQSYLKKSGTTCYRLYDKDMPEYAFAVDLYEENYCHLQEYSAPSTIDPANVRRRRREALEGLLNYLPFGSEGIFLKERRKLGASDRYAGQAQNETRYICKEGNLKFFVNFTDYLDTGLFLDSRELRKKIARLSEGNRFLNLFAYTCTASVAAAAAGARSTVSVDTSATYLKWGEANMRLNGLSLTKNSREISDTFAWLKKARREKSRFDLIYVDPPTYSNSKSRRGDFDIQRDHASLLEMCLDVLSPQGTILFCTNFTRFEPDKELFSKYAVTETTQETIPQDFAHKGKIHRSFLIKKDSSLDSRRIQG